MSENFQILNISFLGGSTLLDIFLITLKWPSFTTESILKNAFRFLVSFFREFKPRNPFVCFPSRDHPILCWFIRPTHDTSERYPKLWNLVLWPLNFGSLILSKSRSLSARPTCFSHVSLNFKDRSLSSWGSLREGAAPINTALGETRTQKFLISYNFSVRILSNFINVSLDMHNTLLFFLCLVDKVALFLTCLSPFFVVVHNLLVSINLTQRNVTCLSVYHKALF